MRRPGQQCKKGIDGLTDAQRDYCRRRSQGLSQRQAYRESIAKPDIKTESLDQSAARLERMEAVKRKIEYYRQLADHVGQMETADIASMLAEMASDDTRPDGIRLKAADQLTRIRGGYSDGLRVDVQGASGDRVDALMRLLKGD